MSSNQSKKVFVEIARTPEQIKQGLMFRKSLPKNSGMLFVFDDEQPLSFWGKNTLIPLDIAFIDAKGIIKDIKKIQKEDLTSVKSSCPCKYALEVAEGWLDRNECNIGNKVNFALDHQPSYIVISKTSKIPPTDKKGFDMAANFDARLNRLFELFTKYSSSPAWTRAEGKNPEGGLNAKGRASYNKATGGNLRPPVKADAAEKSPAKAKRRDSFCARMCGMKKNLTGKATASDPDSRINKALRAWDCNC